MGRARCWLAVALAFLIQRLLVWLPVWGVYPLLLPPLVCLLAMEEGPDRGAECGLLGGVLCWMAGASLWLPPLWALLGAAAGKLFPLPGGFWGKWLRLLPLLAGMEASIVLFHWLTGDPLMAALRVAWPEGMLSAACFPVAAGLVKLVSVRRKA